MKTMCGFIGDPQGRGLMVVGPDVSLERLRTFVTRVFDLMQRAGRGHRLRERWLALGTRRFRP